MNSVDKNNYQFSYNSDTMKITISGNTQFTLNFATSNYKTCWRELGFTLQDENSVPLGVGSPTGPSNVQIIRAPNCISLERPTKLMVTISEFTQTGLNTSLDKFTFYIPITVASGELIKYSYKDFPQHVELPYSTKIETLTITLLLDNGEPADLNGEEFDMLLKLTN